MKFKLICQGDRGLAIFVTSRKLVHHGAFLSHKKESLGRASSVLNFSLLHDDEEEMLVWGNEDLSLLGANSEECHVIHWVQVSYHGPCLLGEICYSSSNLLWCGYAGGVLVRTLLESKNFAILIDNQK